MPAGRVRNYDDTPLGDPNIFGELSEASRPRTYAAILAMVGDPDTAEDLTQKTHLYGWVGRDTFKGEPNAQRFGDWMYGIARRIVAEHYRRGQGAGGPDTSFDELAAGRAGVYEGGDFTVDVENREMLRELLMQLPQRQRVAVALRHLLGMPIAVVAATLGSTPHDVSSDVYRGLQHMRQLAQGMRDSGVVPAVSEE